LVRIVRLGGDAAFDTAGAAGPGSRGSLGSMRREDSGAVAARQGGVALHLIVLSAGALLAITFRFDLFPALLMAAAVWAALARRPALVGVALALGVLAKLFPIAVLPALAVPWLLPLDLRGLARLGASFVATVAVGLLPFIVLAGSESTFQFLQYNAERGLQVESIGGGVAMLAGLVTGQPVEMNFRFSSVNVEGGVADAWLTLIPSLAIGGFALVALVGWRRVREETRFAPRISASTVVELAAVSLLMLLATSKVYSIQYAVWVVPLAALLGGPRFWLAAALVGLTMPIHPLLYEGLVDQEAVPIIVLNLRNALLLVLLGWMLVDLRGARRDMTSVAGPGEPA
jgi:hypothetical protein